MISLDREIRHFHERAPSSFCVRGLGAGLDRLGALEARFEGGRA